MVDSAKLAVDIDRLYETIAASAQIGTTATTGLSRAALTDADKQMRDLFVSWCSAAGLSVEIDELGNIFATRAGSEPGLAPVFIGSHLDTQINGGRFDGIAGVLAGLELIRTLNDNQLSTRRSLVLVNWTGEEGSRFKPTMVASGAYVGFFDTQWVKEQIAFDGARFADELKRIGYDGNKPCKAGAIDAYFELHIEQGPLLDAENKQLGIVTGGYVSHRLEVTFKGKTAHPGPTPMDRRSNALAAAARWLTAVDDIGWQFSIGDGKSTASSLNVLPNQPGIISNLAMASADVRHADPAVSLLMKEKMQRAAHASAALSGCEAVVDNHWSWGGDLFDHGLINDLRELADQLGYDWRDIQSQAGHDAYFLASCCPTAMIFTPCKDGVSHNPDEYSSKKDLEPGANLLLHAVLKQANR